jgi:hypothetical protein
MRKRAPATMALGRRIKVHDRHQFELKLEYRPSEDEAQARYVVEAFVCLPSSLNISPETLPRELLYADIHNYVRLKTPELSWSELGALPTSPLVRLADELDAVERGGDERVFGYECKLMACVFRARLRELAMAIESALPETTTAKVAPATVSKDAIDGIVSEASEALDSVRSIGGRYRALAPRVERAEVPERARAAFRLADEYMSISIEQMLRRVIVAVSRAPLAADATAAAAALKRTLLDTILDEERYRQGRGFTTIIDPRSDNERYIYRAGLLKKYCSSALFLAIHRAFARRRWQELLFAVAAGIAMAFATVVAFWAQARYTKLGLQLFVILVVAYMFKDRLKEATRALFSRLLDQSLYDRKIVIDDPAGGTLGACREKIGYLRAADLPVDAVEIRRRGVDPMVRMAKEELRETVIHYKKEMVLSARRLTERPGGGGVTDILRFHVARWTHDMDEPDQEIEYVDAETTALGAVRAAKTYHVDVVFRFHSRGGRALQTTLMRLILDRNGIKRIERTDGAGRR